MLENSSNKKNRKTILLTKLETKQTEKKNSWENKNIKLFVQVFNFGLVKRITSLKCTSEETKLYFYLDSIYRVLIFIVHYEGAFYSTSKEPRKVGHFLHVKFYFLSKLPTISRMINYTRQSTELVNHLWPFLIQNYSA